MPVTRRRRRTAKEIANARRKAINARRFHLKTIHHMTMEEYAAILEYQGGVCYICLRPPAPGKNLHVDHDHAKAKAGCPHPHEESCHLCWRGLVHRHCNDMLALARDDVMVLFRAISYLNDPPAVRWQAPFNESVNYLEYQQRMHDGTLR